NYIIGDVIVRYRLMRGFEVLSPMGWDAFGLPAENAAIKRNIHPATWTKQNIEKMKAQLRSWGCGYDWKREFATCDPPYYKWTQGVIDRQRARIGRSEGATVEFTVKETGEPLPCYTTRPDTLWGVTYYSVAPEHPICEKLTGAGAAAVKALREKVKKQTNIDR